MIYIQRYGNRAVKGSIEIEAISIAEATRKAKAWLEAWEKDVLLENVKLIGPPILKTQEESK